MNAPGHAGELALVAACARGDGDAISQLRRAYLADVVASVRSLRVADSVADELESKLLEHLLVGVPDRPPRISDYAGSGSLRGWLQATAARLLFTELRKPGRLANVEAPEPASAARSQDVQADRSQRLEGINDGLRRAVAALTIRERNLLRQHYVDGLTTEQVARLYGVHRATAVRWLADAREAVLQRTREAVENLGVRAEEVESLFDVVRSQLDLSLSDLSTESGTVEGQK